jgi:hypothetical protein
VRTNQPPLPWIKSAKIIAEDGQLKRTSLQSAEFGPDAQQLQLHEYIQANPDEVHRIIAYAA